MNRSKKNFGLTLAMTLLMVSIGSLDAREYSGDKNGNVNVNIVDRVVTVNDEVVGVVRSGEGVSVNVDDIDVDMGRDGYGVNIDDDMDMRMGDDGFGIDVDDEVSVSTKHGIKVDDEISIGRGGIRVDEISIGRGGIRIDD